MKRMFLLDLLSLTAAISFLYMTHTISAERCIETFEVNVDKEYRLSANCEIEDELKLEGIFNVYPYLDQNPRYVQYWEGSYNRVITEINYKLRQVINSCEGIILDERIIKSYYKFNKTFSINNPNLSSEIRESFMLSPMSDQRASVELAKTKRKCEEYSSNNL